MPANVTALVRQAEPGGELSCQGPEYDFVFAGESIRRGVLSCFAAATMAAADSFQSWAALIERASEDFFISTKAPKFYQPSIQILGDAGQRLPGINLTV